MYVLNGKFVLNGGTITGGSAGGNGGNINAVTTDGKQAMLTREGIVVTAPAQTKVSVATLDGRSLISFVKQRNGMESRALSLPKGVYIVRVGDKSQKVLLP